MSQAEILEKLNELPLAERVALMEAALHQLKEELQKVELRQVKHTQMSEEELDRLLAEQAQAALPYYLTDKELTIFTALDGEDFYEYDEE